MRPEASKPVSPRLVGGLLIALGGIAAIATYLSTGASPLAVGCGNGSCPGSDSVPLSTILLIALLSVAAAVALGVLVYLVGGSSSRPKDDNEFDPPRVRESTRRGPGVPPSGPRTSTTRRAPSGPSDLNEMMDELERASIEGEEGEPE